MTYQEFERKNNLFKTNYIKNSFFAQYIPYICGIKWSANIVSLQDDSVYDINKLVTDVMEGKGCIRNPRELWDWDGFDINLGSVT